MDCSSIPRAAVLIAAAAALWSAAPLRGQDAGEEREAQRPALANDPGQWRCGQPFEPTRALIEAYRPLHGAAGYAGDRSLPPFSAARRLRQGDDSALFVKHGARWWTYPLPGHAVQAVYAARGRGRAVAFSEFGPQRRGIAEHFAFWTADGFASAACAVLPLPEPLAQRGGRLRIDAFDSDARGAGALQVTALDAPGTRAPLPLLRFEYRTPDHGRSWSEPRLLDAEPAPRHGSYAPLAHPALHELWSDLERFAARAAAAGAAAAR